MAPAKAPEPIVLAATPAPATPPPATPEPVVVKATPAPATPAPVVVVATPVPAATPPPLDFAMVARTPGLWPQQVALVQPASFPVVINGRAAGEVKVPVGTVLRFVRINNLYVEVEYQNARHYVAAASTDLMQRALVVFRNNGSVLPTAPMAVNAPTSAPAATSAPVAPASTNLPSVGVSAERKRLDTSRGTKAGEGSVQKSSERFQYTVQVQSRSFDDVPALDVEYIVFVERQKLGESKDKDFIERITGSGKTEPLTRAVKARSVTTNEIELVKQNLAGNYYYGNGGRIKVEDNIEGIWVKVLYEGKTVAEYASPTTITKRGWEKK